MLESRIEKYLVNEIKKRGGMSFKLNSASCCGLPDRLVLPGEGKIIFVELKAPGKKPRPTQLVIHRQLKRLGMDVRVIDSLESVAKFINEIYTS